jgi:hypothetical protein
VLRIYPACNQKTATVGDHRGRLLEQRRGPLRAGHSPDDQPAARHGVVAVGVADRSFVGGSLAAEALMISLPFASASVRSIDASAAMNPDVSVFVDDVHAAHDAAVSSGAEIVHPLTEEKWGVTMG